MTVEYALDYGVGQLMVHLIKQHAFYVRNKFHVITVDYIRSSSMPKERITNEPVRFTLAHHSLDFPGKELPRRMIHNHH